MPRFPPVYHEFFYAPLTEDVEELLARFQHTDSVRFQIFSGIWRQMSFSDVFRGLGSVTEMSRFCRVTLATAVKYFLPPYSYQIRVGALYLMFGFYRTQLAAPPVKIRLALKDWEHVQRFLRDSMDAGHLDVLYVYRKLVAAKAVHYAAMPHQLTFMKQRKPRKEPLCADFLGRSTAVQELLPPQLLEELAHIQHHYERMKGDADVRRHAGMTNPDFSGRLRDCASEFVAWQERMFSQESRRASDEDDDDEAAAAGRSRAQRLAAIKQKSYGGLQEAPRSRRHRQAEMVETSVTREVEAPQRRRPLSLRARTWRALGAAQEDGALQQWLLSAPDQDKVPVKRSGQAPPFRP